MSDDKIKIKAIGVVLTEEDVHCIRASSYPPKTLAEIYGVSVQTIRDILLGRTWKWLT